MRERHVLSGRLQAATAATNRRPFPHMKSNRAIDRPQVAPVPAGGAARRSGRPEIPWPRGLGGSPPLGSSRRWDGQGIMTRAAGWPSDRRDRKVRVPGSAGTIPNAS